MGPGRRATVAGAVALVWALVFATAASATLKVQVGHDQRAGVAGGCDYSGATTCVYVQAYWNMVNGVVAPDSLPLNSDGVVTHVHGEFYGAGTVRLRVVHGVPDYPLFDVLASSPPLTVMPPGVLDADVRLPIHQGDALAFSLSDGAKPYWDYEAGGTGPGGGILYYSATDSDTQIGQIKQVIDGDELDGLVFDATVEPAGSVPAPSAGPAPAVPAAPAALADAGLRGRQLTYTLARRAHVGALLERRHRGHWRVARRIALPGAAGAHRVVLPRMSRRIARVVLVARSLAGRLEGRMALDRP
jgi:hypothetical protein